VLLLKIISPSSPFRRNYANIYGLSLAMYSDFLFMAETQSYLGTLVLGLVRIILGRFHKCFCHQSPLHISKEARISRTPTFFNYFPGSNPRFFSTNANQLIIIASIFHKATNCFTRWELRYFFVYCYKRGSFVCFIGRVVVS